LPYIAPCRNRLPNPVYTLALDCLKINGSGPVKGNALPYSLILCETFREFGVQIRTAISQYRFREPHSRCRASFHYRTLKTASVWAGSETRTLPFTSAAEVSPNTVCNWRAVSSGVPSTGMLSAVLFGALL
jgi:hypothetical protein